MGNGDLHYSAKWQSDGEEHLDASAGDGPQQPVYTETRGTGAINLNEWGYLEYGLSQPSCKHRLFRDVWPLCADLMVDANHLAA